MRADAVPTATTADSSPVVTRVTIGSGTGPKDPRLRVRGVRGSRGEEGRPMDAMSQQDPEGPSRDAGSSLRKDLTGQVRGLTRRLATTSIAVAAVAPGPLRHVLAMFARTVDELPSVAEQLDVLMAEVHAQRLGLQSVEAELAALDSQLAVLERSLAPVSAWTHQTARLRSGLADMWEPLPDERE